MANTENAEIKDARSGSLERSVGRRIVGISVTGVENTSNTQCNYVAMAVCEDGSVWQIRNVDAEWYELPPIPPPSNARTERPAHSGAQQPEIL